ncbi:hypothetical protein [Rhodococcus sp. Q]|uniref:hypothetical protein n=1 Tax=Rhodococcus sp. Q TaxID=2502252 RepID=UPI0010F75807|nr:hypothetical protein [Rhodococcus sp. Q]
MEATPVTNRELIERIVADQRARQWTYDDNLLESCEIAARLASFNIEGDHELPAYLAARYRMMMHRAEIVDFTDLVDTHLQALGDAVGTNLAGVNVHKIALNEVLHDHGRACERAIVELDKAAELLRYLPTAAYVNDWSLFESLDKAVLLVILSDDPSLEHRLWVHLTARNNHPALRDDVLGDYRAQSEFAASLLRYEDDALAREILRRQIRVELADVYLGRYRFLEPYWELGEHPERSRDYCLRRSRRHG